MLIMRTLSGSFNYIQSYMHQNMVYFSTQASSKATLRQRQRPHSMFASLNQNKFQYLQNGSDSDDETSEQTAQRKRRSWYQGVLLRLQGADFLNSCLMSEMLLI